MSSYSFRLIDNLWNTIGRNIQEKFPDFYIKPYVSDINLSRGINIIIEVRDELLAKAIKEGDSDFIYHPLLQIVEWVDMLCNYTEYKKMKKEVQKNYNLIQECKKLKSLLMDSNINISGESILKVIEND